MAIALVQSNAGNTGTGTPTSLNATLPGAPTAGNTLLLAVSSDATVNTPAGWTLDKSQVNDNGQYLFRKVSAGTETTVVVSPTAGASTVWAYLEYSGIATTSPLAAPAISAGSSTASTTRSTGTTATTSGATGGIAIAAFGISLPGAGTATVDSYTNSFTEVTGSDQVTTKATGTNVAGSVASVAVAADGTFTCTATFSANRANTGILAVYKPAAGGASQSADGTRATTATITGTATVTKSASGDLTATATATGAATSAKSAAGTLAVTATRTAAGAIAKLFKTLHQSIGHAPASRADMDTAFTPNTASGGWHRGDGAHPIHGTGWSLYCFNDFFVSDGAGGVNVFFRRNSVLMVDHDDGQVWWLSSGDGFGIAGSVTFPWGSDNSWSWLRGGWATASDSCILLGDIYGAGGTLVEHRVMAVTGLTGSSPPYTVTYPCGLDVGTVNWQGSPVVVGGYAYLYGVGGLSQYVARAAVTTDATAYGPGAWEYWTGSGWSTTFANRAPISIQTPPLRALTFIAWNGRYLAAAKDFDASPELALSNTDWTELKVWVADAPTGPWAYHGIVYDTEVTDWWSYTARAELLPGMTDLSVIWSINTDISFDADLYGPIIAAPMQVGRFDVAAAITGTAGLVLSAAGTLTATATISGTASTAKPVDGTRGVTATITGAAAVDKPAAGTLTATATITGAATVTKTCAGDLTATATATGTAGKTSSAAGTTSVTATITGSATVAKAAAGDLTATATSTGAGVAGRSVNGTVTATASLAGGVNTAQAATGTLAVTATASGTGTGTKAAGGDLAVVASPSGTGTRAVPAAGNISVAATITGDADVPGSPDADGTLVATATVAGTASGSYVTTGTVSATATATGTANLSAGVTGTLTSTATASGSANVDRAAAGSSTVTAAITGTATVARAVSGDLTATATSAGTASANRQATGSLTVVAGLDAEATLDSEPQQAAGNLEVTAGLAGTANVATTAVGNLAAGAAITGTPAADRPAAGAVTVAATVTGAATVTRAASGTIAVTATISGATTTESQPVTVTPPHATGPLDDVQHASGYNAGTATLTVSGVANGTVDRVDIAVDGTPAGTATGTLTWTFQVTTASWVAGPHTIVATGHLTAGGTTDPSTVTVWHNPTGMYGAAAEPGQHLVPVALSGAP